MAPSAGRTKRTLSCCEITVVGLLFCLIPYIQAGILPDFKLFLPHDIPEGFTITKLHFPQECVLVKGVNNHSYIPFTLQSDGKLVTDQSVQDMIGQVFVVQPRSNFECLKQKHFSPASQQLLSIEIINSCDSLGFMSDLYTGNIAKDSPSGTLVDGLSDLYACRDQGCKDHVFYDLVGEGSENFVVETTVRRGQEHVHLRTSRPLVHAQVDTYYLTLVAQGHLGSRGQSNIWISVTGNSQTAGTKRKQDESLKYLTEQQPHHLYRRQANVLRIPEGTQGRLFAITAQPNTEYSLESSTSPNLFDVRTDGQVFLASGQTLDYDSMTDAQRTIVIVINGKNTNGIVTETITRTIEITDVNDELPIVTNQPVPYLTTMSENDPQGTLIYTLRATDPDTTAQLTFTQSTELDLFSTTRIPNNGLEIRTAKRPEESAYTTDAVYTVRILITDTNASQPNTQRVSVGVEIKVGDRPPQFMKQSYVLEFQEENFKGLKITGSEPINAKSFQGRPITYRLEGSNGQPQSRFSIDGNGDIRVEEVLDYESTSEQRQFNLIVVAEETIQLQTRIALTINLRDLNEFDPTFSKSVYQVTKPENIAVDTSLLQVNASDRDYNSLLSFSVDDDHFRIVSDSTATTTTQTATIFVNKPLDYDRRTVKQYNFIVKVTDNGDIPRSGTTRVRVFVTNLNDEVPVFPEMHTEIWADTPADSDVFTARATDDDEGDIVSHRLQGSSDMFRINNVSGIITLTRSLPTPVMVFQYKLEVIAVDDSSCCPNANNPAPHTSTGTVTIDVITDNQYRPQFVNCAGYRPSVLEEKLDEFVIQVSATDDDIGKSGEITFSLAPPPNVDNLPPFSDGFYINNQTGQIYTGVKIDRERLQSRTTIAVTALATDGGGLQTSCSFLVSVNDTNDNAPIFSIDNYNRSIPRTINRVMQVKANDADLGLNSRIDYSLSEQDPDGYFRIDEFNGFIDRILPLDIEAGSHIKLTVRATDKGTPPLSTEIDIYLTVVDDQSEQPPVWDTNADYTVFVDENTGQGDLILLNASSANSQSIIYSISDSNTDEDKDKFFVNAANNFLSVKPGLDYEKQIQHRVSVTAAVSTDIFSVQVVTVNVRDLNDKVPFFLNSGSKGIIRLQSILEGNYNKSVPTVIDTLQASDADGTSPNNRISQIRKKPSNTDTDDIFSIDPSTGVLTTTGVFDRETKDIYVIIVEALDGAESSLISGPNVGKAQVEIIIGDVNDNPPIFKQDHYEREVNEDKQIGYTVTTISAEDVDIGDVLTYRFTDQSDSLPFTIHPRTANIDVAATLDYENPSGRFYVFGVEVTDGIHSSSTSVSITVNDVNDNPPTVAPIPIFDTISEAFVPPSGGELLTTVTANDKDNNGVNNFIFSLDFTTSKDSNLFRIDADGNLYQMSALDRDLPHGRPEYSFTVNVADDDQNPLYGYGVVVVRPVDVNDNPPKVLEEGSTMRVYENSDLGTQVGKVPVVDYDEGQNAQFTLSIVGQAPDEGAFALDSNNEYIITNNNLDRERQDRYTISLKAVDKGDPPLTGYGTITVIIDDRNDNLPYFLKSEYHFTMSETNKVGGEVGRVQSVDLDIDNNAKRTYLLDGPLEKFSIGTDESNDKQDGIITLYSEVDFDKNQTFFEFTIRVTDRGERDDLNSTRVTVRVSDYNDEVPKFNPSQIEVTVSENATVGIFIAQFTATDADINSTNNQFTYHIDGNTDRLNQFQIDPVTGVVRLRNKLDRETDATHSVDILAIDGGTPQQTGTATLSVIVSDINDNFPDFAVAYKPTIDEGDHIDTLVVTFSAVDPDEDKPEKFQFDLSCSDSSTPDSACDKFFLTFNQNGDGGRGTGSLFGRGSFDRKEHREIDVPIRMTDNRGQNAALQQSGIRHLTVEVKHKNNDYEHFGTTKDILVYNYKGEFGNIPIGTVPVDDEDYYNGDKTYGYENEEMEELARHLVSLDTETGVISLNDNVPEMKFTIGFSVTGPWQGAPKTVISKVTVDHVYIPEDAVYNSGGMRVKGITPEDFIEVNSDGSSMRGNLQLVLAEYLKTDAENVFVLTANSDAEKTYTDIRYAAHGSPYYQASRSDGVVNIYKDKIEENVFLNQGTIDMVPIDLCKYETCEGGCYNELTVGNDAVLVNSDTTSFVGIDARVVSRCGCRAKNFSSNIGCTPGYCYHGGTCVQDDWGVVSCECPEDYEGPRCQRLRQSFDGTGYALYNPLEQCENSRTSIEILTNNSNGVIIYNGPTEALEQTDNEDYLLLDLVQGSPRLQINHGSGSILLQFSASSNSPNLADGTWHHIDIIRNEKDVQLIVDHCLSSTENGNSEDRSSCEVKGRTPGPNRYLNVGTPLHLGGVKTAPPSGLGLNFINTKFNGCMRKLTHNAELYDLSTEGAFEGATDGCKAEDDSCSDNCNNGQCEVQTKGQGICICHPGYMDNSNGERCTDETPVVDFGTSSYIDWVMKDTFYQLLNNKRTEVTLSYRTRDRSGVLFHLTGMVANTFITLKITNNVLSLEYNLGGSFNSLEISSSVEASDGQWHILSLERYGKEFIMKVDSGEGRYYADTIRPGDGRSQLILKQNELYSGADLTYNNNVGAIQGEDLVSSCLNDIRLEKSWVSVAAEYDIISAAATVNNAVEVDYNCSWPNDCVGKCSDPYICKPLWGAFKCICRPHYVEVGLTCTPVNYCDSNPCFGDAQCIDLNPCNGSSSCTAVVDPNKQYFSCDCKDGWYGNLCQCHSKLNSGGEACIIPQVTGTTTALSGGAIAGIIIAILFLIALIVALIIYCKCGRREKQKPPFLDDDLDDIRETVMFYDEEGAGEEDQTGYDLNRLRKPDDGEYPSNLDMADIPRSHNKPLYNSERPDIGNFIGSRLNDADDDPDGSPDDTPIDFNFEGEGSIATSLSSLNASSSGDQDYNYLNDWGPKFAKLADMYNDYEDDE